MFFLFFNVFFCDFLNVVFFGYVPGCLNPAKYFFGATMASERLLTLCHNEY